MNTLLSKLTVGVIGSGSQEYTELAREVGELLAMLEVNLLTGGGRGVMTSVSRAYTQAIRQRGICIGIIPCLSARERDKPKDGYPNEYVELPIFTHLPYSGHRGTDDLSRNHINVLSCSTIIALPGGEGTATEVALALDYQKPVVAYSPDASLVQGFPEAVKRATNIGEVKMFLQRHLEQTASTRVAARLAVSKSELSCK